MGEGEKDRAKGRAWGVAARRVRPSVKSGVVADRGVAPFTALAQSELLGRRARPPTTTLGVLGLRIARADGAQGGGTNGVLVGINLLFLSPLVKGRVGRSLEGGCLVAAHVAIGAQLA